MRLQDIPVDGLVHDHGHAMVRAAFRVDQRRKAVAEHAGAGDVVVADEAVLEVVAPDAVVFLVSAS